MSQTSKKRRTAEPEIEEAFLEPILAVHRHIDLAEQLKELMNRAAHWMQAECGFALAPGEDGVDLEFIHGTLRRTDPRWRGLEAVKIGRIKRVLRNGVEAFDGLGPFDAVCKWNEGLPRTTVGVPVVDESGRWCGVLMLFLETAADPEALTRLRSLMELSRPALTNGRKVEALRELVIKDDTARCFNRRYFEEFLPEELSRANRFGKPLALIFLDMDNLKQLNNAHGHAMGSQSLTEVAARIRRKIRKFDKLFRFGGDEFVIVLPETDSKGALEVAERVGEAIREEPFLVRDLDNGGVSMTASLGIASFPEHSRTQQDLIRMSDRAMQKVKGQNKNGIGIAENTGGEGGS